MATVKMANRGGLEAGAVSAEMIPVEDRMVAGAFVANLLLCELSERCGMPFPAWTQYAEGEFWVGFEDRDVKIRCPKHLHADCEAIAAVVVDTFDACVYGEAGTGLVPVVTNVRFSTKPGPPARRRSEHGAPR